MEKNDPNHQPVFRQTSRAAPNCVLTESPDGGRPSFGRDLDKCLFHLSASMWVQPRNRKWVITSFCIPFISDARRIFLGRSNHLLAGMRSQVYLCQMILDECVQHQPDIKIEMPKQFFFMIYHDNCNL
jgi:hypothetical protein